MLSAGSHAQVKEIVGYIQYINAGTRQVDHIPKSQAGEENMISSGTARYFLFLEIKNGKTVSVEEVWIKGSRFNFKTDTIKQLPFVLKSSSGGEMVFTDTLVRSADGTIIRLTDLVKTDNALIPGNIKNKIVGNDAVIVFKCRKKLHSKTIRQLNTLNPIFAQ
jgi:hypothetical protein